jgi:hypothetical protein
MIRISFNAVPDPAFLVNVDTDTDLDPVPDLSWIQHFDDQKFTTEKKNPIFS